MNAVKNIQIGGEVLTHCTCTTEPQLTLLDDDKNSFSVKNLESLVLCCLTIFGTCRVVV